MPAVGQHEVDPKTGTISETLSYPDPKIVTVAATTNTVNTTRPTPPRRHPQRRRNALTQSRSEAADKMVADFECPAGDRSA